MNGDMETLSNSSSSCSSDESLDEVNRNILQAGEILGYQFEPRRDSVSDESSSEDDENMWIDDEQLLRLENTDWCSCECCQIMDREAECICCQEVEQVVHKNNEVFVEEHPPQNLPDPRSYRCITDNPGFRAVCLNRWVLQVAWLQYRQQYGNKAFEGPERKILRHIAYRQLVRWCWGVLGKDIRVVLPSCAVSCIRAHFSPPGVEENFQYVGFLFADE